MATVARALSGGFRPACLVILGIVLGDLIFLLAAIYGLALMAQLLGSLFIFIKWLGGLYLIYLGFKMLLSKDVDREFSSASNTSLQGADFLCGLAITLGNPKVIVFYLSFLPAFMDLTALSTWDIVTVSTVVSLVLGGTMLSYAAAAARARDFITQKGVIRRVRQAGGGLLIGSGVLLISKS